MVSVNQAASICFTQTTIEKLNCSFLFKTLLKAHLKAHEWIKRTPPPLLQYSINTSSVKPKEFVITKEALRPLFINASKWSWGRIAAVIVGLASLVLGCLAANKAKHIQLCSKREHRCQHSKKINNSNHDQRHKEQVLFCIKLTTFFVVAGAIAIGSAWMLQRRAFNQATHLITLLDTQGVASAIKVVQERGAVESLLGDLIKKAFKTQYPAGGHLFNGNKHFAYVK